MLRWRRFSEISRGAAGDEGRGRRRRDGASPGGTFSAPGCCLRSRRRLVSIVTSYCVAPQDARSMPRRFVPTVTLWRRSVFGGACNVSSKSLWVGSAMLAPHKQWAVLMR